MPTVTLVAGDPDIVGARFGAAFTVIAKAGSDALAVPSLTDMTMPVVVPTCSAAGVPDRRPVELLKLAHAGRFEIE
jgi:hypothetical protein